MKALPECAKNAKTAPVDKKRRFPPAARGWEASEARIAPRQTGGRNRNAGHPLTAPTMPEIRYFWKKTYTTMTGMMESSTPALSSV